ncbi:MAG: hydroxymethylbilane synthase [Candidatus Omnitrophota bacterium]
MDHKIIVGARKSQLSLTQTNSVIRVLKGYFPDHGFEFKAISTAGDRNMDHAALFHHQGIFVKEIEEALLRGEIDLGIHSLKDMPCDIRAGLSLGAVGEREDPRDAFLSGDGSLFRALKPGASIGTSSVRRRAQILSLRPDLKVVDMRGNVDTRLKKLRSGDVDALVIACAGLVRLGQGEFITERLPFDMMLPAPCQGALGLEIRQDDARLKAIVSKFDHALTRACVTAERAFLKTLGGGCSLPVGALACLENDVFTLTGQVVDPDGRKEVRKVMSGTVDAPEALGEKLAGDLLNADGAWIKLALRSPYSKK